MMTEGNTGRGVLGVDAGMVARAVGGALLIAIIAAIIVTLVSLAMFLREPIYEPTARVWVVRELNVGTPAPGPNVVTPHRAQMGKVVGRLQGVFPDHEGAAIWNAVDTVERFQGQQRDVIVGSFGLGDPDLIRAEEEFLYNLNRFNVMASRARAKLIVLTTRSLVDHLSDDAEVLKESRLLKTFAVSFCTHPKSVTLSYCRPDGSEVPQPGVLRTR